MSNLVRIDELLIREHGSLSMEDECYYLLEYTAREGYTFSQGNDLIQNLKKPMDRRSRPEWRHKERAILKIAQELAPALPIVINFAKTTIIPIPPSKVQSSPLYDDRLLQILIKACPPGADIREIITCREDRAAAHENSSRPSVKAIMDNYVWNDLVGENLKPTIVLFDDMVTGGNHYVACRNLILEKNPKAKIVGIFVARRVLPMESPFEDYKDIF